MEMYKIEELVFSEAVRHFWQARQGQAEQQKQRGVSDRGKRGSATAGRHMDGFIQKIVYLMLSVGVSNSDICIKTSNTDLPGFFRPTKK